jgi:hypothetical protein
LGPLIDGSIISVGSELPWVAAIGFVFVAGVALLIWKRTRTREELALQKVAAHGIGARGIENHAAQPIAVENAVATVVEDSEECGHDGRVSDQPAPQETISSPVVSEGFGIPSGDAREAGVPEKLPVEDPREPDVEVAVLPPVVEALPAVPNIESDEERNQENSRIITVDSGEEITAEIAEIAQEKPGEFPGDGDSMALAEPIDETQIAGHNDNVKHYVQTEESDESAEADQAAPVDEGEQFAEKMEEAEFETEDSAEDEIVPGRYRAPVLGPGKTQRRKAARSGEKTQEQVLELRIRAVSDRHGFCRFQIVGKRPARAPAELEARGGRRTVALSEVADEWYAVTELNDLPVIMERGIRFSASAGDSGEMSWALRGRDLYVLAGLQGIFGFVSTARLSIGEEQIVLCRESRAAEVQTILAEAGCDGVQAHGRDDGAPSGWVFFRPVNPSRSVPQVSADDILNVIRPIPDIEVRLEGGLWLRGSSWISGYAPKIHVAGELPPGTQVMIDGEAAEEREPRVYATSSSERPGNHAVWCGGRSASYEICEPDVRWEESDAGDFSRRVCGAVAAGADNAHGTLVSVPTSNSVLIGANPGEVFRCDRRPGKLWTGFVPFRVCWALPEDALHCDRSLRRVLLIRPLPPVHYIVRRFRKMSVSARVLQWCHAIRDCQRKRLALSPADAASEQLWREYRCEAKAVWRAAR